MVRAGSPCGASTLPGRAALHMGGAEKMLWARSREEGAEGKGCPRRSEVGL